MKTKQIVGTILLLLIGGYFYFAWNYIDLFPKQKTKIDKIEQLQKEVEIQKSINESNLIYFQAELKKSPAERTTGEITPETNTKKQDKGGQVAAGFLGLMVACVAVFGLFILLDC